MLSLQQSRSADSKMNKLSGSLVLGEVETPDRTSQNYHDKYSLMETLTVSQDNSHIQH